MKKLIKIFLFLASFVYASENVVNIKDLFEKSKKYDGKRVIFTGEAIGDLIKSGENYWVNVKEGEAAIGVFLEKKDAKKIKYLGRYGIRGDTLKIEGIYHANCPGHYGERDIHAIKVEVIDRGEILKKEIEFKKVILSFILAITTLFFIYYSHRVSRKDSGGSLQ